MSAETGTDLVSMNDLRDAVYDAIQWYEIDRSVAASSSKITLHEISPHIERVIELIAQEENKHHVLLALGNFDGYSADLDNAVNHYELLISDLRKIARDVPRAVKRSKGRPFREKSSACLSNVSLTSGCSRLIGHSTIVGIASLMDLLRHSLTQLDLFMLLSNLSIKALRHY